MKNIPSYVSGVDVKRFFYTAKDEFGDEETRPCRFVRSTVVVTTSDGDKVAFYKSNRSKTFGDSRGRKVTKKDEWGNVDTIIRPLKISDEECLSELRRMLCDDALADRLRTLE